MQLCDRLQAIYRLVPEGSRVADIGTDHGYLPIALRRGNIAVCVIACDIRKKPLDNARKNIKKSGEIGIDLRLGDGLSEIKKGEVDTIIIAGMGGDVIASILSRCGYIKDPDFLLFLQPMTGAGALRTFLAENGFRIDKETPVCDRDRVYSIFSVRYDGNTEKTSDDFEWVGMMTAKTPEGKRYIEKQLKIVSALCERFSSLSIKPELLSRYRAAKKQIEQKLEKL